MATSRRAGTGGYSLYPVAPCRVLDTRNNGGKPFTGEKMVNVVSSACAPPSGATAYVFNATVVPPGSMPYSDAVAGRLRPAERVDPERLRRLHYLEHGDCAHEQWLHRRLCRRASPT